MKQLKDDFMDILEKQRIRPVFQAIVSLGTGGVIGYEALSRIVNPHELRSSEELFHLAGIYGKVWELEQICRNKILEKYHMLQSPDDQKLFLNVNPLVIHDRDFHAGFTKGTLGQYGIRLENIVYEVTERSAVDDIKGFKDTIRHYKAQGYTIAVDDAGSCYSGLNLICDIVPHYLKLDMTLIHGINHDNVKKAMVKSLAEFANLTGIQLIAEGIETAAELETLLKLGVHNGQGYFLCRPEEELPDVSLEALHIIHKYHQKKRTQLAKGLSSQTEYRVVLFTFDSRKAFNTYCEKYGDEAGDKLNELLEQIVVQNLSENEHAIRLGEDGVLVVFEKPGHKTKCEIIQTAFRTRVLDYYSEEDQKGGCLDRHPLLSLCAERVV